MSDIEKRARELLAAHLPKGSGFWRAPLLDPQYPADYFPDTYQAAINAIVCSITPPEGYVLSTAVLATATRLRRLASAASPLGRKAYIKAAEDIEMTVSAARPEVNP